MNVWPLDKSSYVTFENIIKETFGKTNVKINYVDIFNSGFLLHSHKEPSPTTLFPNSTHLGLNHNRKRFGSQVLQVFHVSENKI